MLEKILRLYVMAMAYDVRSPMPHLVGPPGCGKSTYVEQLAELLSVELHVINVSRLSPLDVEGVQMPHGTGEDMALKMLPATFWTSLKEGDVLLLDEFLRGFPEVYNSLLDIFTSRRVGAFRLPKVFIIAASNSTTAYDKALEDRLLHLPVTDPRKVKTEKARLGKILVNAIGLHPDMATIGEMTELLDNEVLPMYDLLDSFKKSGNKVTKGDRRAEGASLRNLIGQAQLRMVTSTYLRDLITVNNLTASSDGKHQYVVLLDAKRAVVAPYKKQALKLRDNPKLTPLQKLNIEMNLELIGLEEARTQHDEDNSDGWDAFTVPPEDPF